MTKTITYRSKVHYHPTNNRAIWWYNIPPEGGKLQPGDRIEFKLEDCKPGKITIFTFLYEGEWRDRIKSATKNRSNRYILVKILRYRDSPNYEICFGRASDGKYQINEEELSFVTSNAP